MRRADQTDLRGISRLDRSEGKWRLRGGTEYIKQIEVDMIGEDK